jgi:hypothetical protein
MKISQKHWATLRITGYTPAEYLMIRDAAIQSNCRIIFEKRTLVIAGTSTLTCVAQFTTFKSLINN